MAMNSGKSFLMDRYLDELKRIGEEQKQSDSLNEVQVLKEQLRRLSAEMIGLRQVLGLHQRPPAGSCPGACPRHVLNNQDSGYSDNLADSLSPASSISSSSSSASASASSSSSSSSSFSCAHPSSPSPMTSRLTSDLYSRLDDLVKMPRPADEESVCRVLHQRWLCGECQTRIGPVLLSMNPQHGLAQDQVLQYSQPSQHPHLQRLVKRIQSQLVETCRPQAVILGGESGSGKTYTSLLLLRQLHSLHRVKRMGERATELKEDKQFQSLVAACHVLRAIGCAKTTHNSSASRVGSHIEVQVSGNAVTNTKFHCHWFDQGRLVDAPIGEGNFHVFYQMLAGLTQEERVKLHLHGYGTHNLAYLKHKPTGEDAEAVEQRFNTVRGSMSALGIEFMDVARILAATLLLGNICFVEDGGYELDIKGNNEIKSVASLLGVSGVSLYRALTTRTQNLRGQAVQTLCNADMANQTRDTLAKALYCRTVLAITKRINSVLKQSASSARQTEPSVGSEDAQSSGDSCTRSCDSANEVSGSAVLPEGGRATHSEGTIHIVDMPGFSNSQCNRLEDLCSNFSAEVLQQLYLQQVLKNSHTACLEEALDVGPPTFHDNALCLELCAGRNGLFPAIDGVCNQPTLQTVDIMMAKIKKLHHGNSLLSVESENKHLFTISHTSGEVRYSAVDFVSKSRDVISDEVVSIFRRKGCSLGFAAHLFAPELKLLQGNVAQGLLFRITPRPQVSREGPGRSLESSIGSLPIDSHLRLQASLDSLLGQQAQFHFVHCLKISDQHAGNQFSLTAMKRQVKTLQLVPTLRHMKEGYPHHQTLTHFVQRYRVMLQKRERHTSQKEQCTVVLEQIKRRCELMESGSVQNKWLISESRVFFSEETRRALESVRDGHRDTSARFLQSKVRCWLARRHWPSDVRPYDECHDHHATRISFREPLYERIHLPTSSNCSVKSDSSSIEYKKARLQCRVYDTAQELPPPLPSNHPSTTRIDVSRGFPQTRIMRCSYSPDSSCVEPVLRSGEPILVMGVTSTKDMLIVEHNSCTLHVPLKLTMMQTGHHILGTSL